MKIEKESDAEQNFIPFKEKALEIIRHEEQNLKAKNPQAHMIYKSFMRKRKEYKAVVDEYTENAINTPSINEKISKLEEELDELLVNSHESGVSEILIEWTLLSTSSKKEVEKGYHHQALASNWGTGVSDSQGRLSAKEIIVLGAALEFDFNKSLSEYRWRPPR